jgi:hypothetical protein
VLTGLSRLVGQQIMLHAGSSMVPPLGVRAEHMAQAGATEGSPMLLSNAFTSIVLLKEGGPSGGLHHALLLSRLAGFSELVLLKQAPPFKVTDLPAQVLQLLVSVQSIRFLVAAQSLRLLTLQLLCFLVAAQ